MPHSWTGNEERKRQGKVLLPPLPILEFDAEIPIHEVLAATDRPVMRNRARALFSRLADMTEEQRTDEIRELNSQLRRFGKPAGIMSLDTLDTAVSAGSTAISATYPPLAGFAHLGAQLFEIGKRYPAVDRFLEAVLTDLFPGGHQKARIGFSLAY